MDFFDIFIFNNVKSGLKIILFPAKQSGFQGQLAFIRTEIQSHTSPRCATSPVAQLYEPSVFFTHSASLGEELFITIV